MTNDVSRPNRNQYCFGLDGDRGFYQALCTWQYDEIERLKLEIDYLREDRDTWRNSCGEWAAVAAQRNRDRLAAAVEPTPEPEIVHMGLDGETPHRGRRADCTVCTEHKKWCAVAKGGACTCL